MRIQFFDLRKLAFIIAPILSNALTDPDSLNLLGIQWILNVVITEMNLYEAEYCLCQKNKNVLLFNDSNFSASENNKSIASSVHDFFQTFTENYKNYVNLHLTGTGLIEFNYLNVKYLHNVFF